MTIEQKRITLYASAASPFPHRVRLALEEGKAVYKVIWVDLVNKQDWYQKKVYPDGAKVPYLIYGGPELHADETPSPDALKLPESLVILEFLADVFPDAHLLPADPALRARARLFYTAVETELLPAYKGFLLMGAPPEDMLAALNALQERLPPAGYAVGEWSIADAAVMPILLRLLMSAKSELGAFAPGAAKAVLAALEGPEFARLRRYIEDNCARPSMATTWDEGVVKEEHAGRLAKLRKAGLLGAPALTPG